MLCLSLFQLLQQNTADRGACKQQRFVALSSGGRKSEIRVLARLDEGSLLGRRLLICPPMEEGRDLSAPLP